MSKFSKFPSPKRVASLYSKRAGGDVEISSRFAKWWSAVHLTPRYLGEEVVIRAKPPREPYLDQNWLPIEDAETDRISVAESIEDALLGLKFEEKEAYHVYAAGPRERGFDVVDPLKWKSRCPSSEGNPYGPDFDWKAYALDNDVPWKDSKIREEAVRLCVPDLEQTREKWLLRSTPMVWIGEYRHGKLTLTEKHLSHLLTDVLGIPAEDQERVLRSLR